MVRGSLMKNAMVVAITVTFNPNIHDLKKQILVLLNDCIVVLVDNCSFNIQFIDEMVKDISSSKLILIRNSSNIGLAAAQNLGVEEARKVNPTHLIFFDQDSVPSPEMVEQLIDYETELKTKGYRVGAVGPSIYDPITQKSYPVSRYKGPFIVRCLATNDVVTEATFLISSGCLISMNVMSEVGDFESELFIDYIDVEWSLRAASHGYQLFVSPKAKMSHCIGDKRISFFGRTISQHSALRRYYLTRNCFYMISLKYVPLGYKTREIALNLLRVVVFFILSNDRSSYLYYIRRALRDGFRGKYGKFCD